MKRIKSASKFTLVTLFVVGTVVLIVFLSNRGSGGGEPKGTYHSPTVFAMDTTLDITIQGRAESQAKADADAAARLAKEIESHTSMFIDTSDVSRINAGAGTAPVQVHDDTLFLVQKSLEYASLTGGVFDITVAPIVALWGFYNEDYRVPSQAEIDRTLPLVGYGKVMVNGEARTVMLAEKGMQIDLGGIAKGYAVERIYRLLEQRGVKSALINFGGSVGALGRRTDGKKWSIGVKYPRSGGGALAGELAAENVFVNTSGDYERYFIKGGVRYCHIFDPATGLQPRGVMSATIVGPDATVADVLSKVPFIMGTEKGLDFMKSQTGFEALVIDEKGNVTYTPKMKNKYVTTMMEKI